jgi:hypothetical protein
MINQRDPFGQPILYGSPYYAPGTYQEGMPLPPAAGAMTGIQGQQIPTTAQPQAPTGVAPTVPAAPKKDPIPAAPPEPYRGFSKADASKMRMADITAASKSLEEDQKAKKMLAVEIQDIDRFRYLNKQSETGPMTGAGPIGAARRLLGDKELQEMQSITDKLTPGMRQGLPGSASENDTRMFASATVGTGKDAEVNESVGTGLKTSRQNAIDFTDFKQEYFDKNQTLRGAEVKWNEYLEANPIFDPNAPSGSYELNPNRQGYKDHFSGKWTPKTVRYGGKKIRITDPKKYKAFLKDTGQE